MTIHRTRTFRSGNSEAIRLPKDIAFGPDVELVIVRSGDVMTIYPAQARPKMQELLEKLDALPLPGAVEERDTEEIPERPGL